VLSDHERKTLREVERQFQAEDPDFTRSFEARQTRLARHPRKLGVRLTLGSAALLAVFVLIAGSLAGALAIAFATWLIWLVWRHSGATERRIPP
jgi:Flp pilus assembly protein TadB